MRKVVLASASPRRRDLLQQVNIEFEICPSQIEEHMIAGEPQQTVMSLASQKAMDVAQRVLTENDERIVLGADTIVAYQGKILGKPQDAKDAFKMLDMLSGHIHQVYTGVCMIENTDGVLNKHTFYEQTDVKMYPLSQTQINQYIASGEPMDKAGSYGIQGMGAAFIESIHGDYNNVVGLPVSKIWQYLYQAQEACQE